MRGLPFYVKREAFARADTRQRVAYILSAVLVITMLCVIFRFSAADATHSSHLSEGICIRLVRELNSVFPEQFPKEKLVKVAEAIEYPIRKCAHFTEYAVLGITVNLYLWMCYRMEMLLSRKKKAKDIQRTEEKLQKTVKQKAVVQENVLPEIRNTTPLYQIKLVFIIISMTSSVKLKNRLLLWNKLNLMSKRFWNCSSN